ncbi:inter-alpha-trypsin inhibitor family protein [Fadolivirus algeromassiliense]|jgi:hypothetical protein|uniref:Inter-alpha-trypsin inhibitor family protein n=1 Tax=Fadolivirus FV1/VV64 TaxID=3070911 RepID=A0A7D3QUE7_9VIRU|nr:inter-alpha-trypsin inhibitor family protein [Fadolivirus algeromassiliense]QKF93464.1 inter-alpha-trypsin inhibitor family protein [Fadolivirus FV1/VV64]
MPAISLTTSNGSEVPLKDVKVLVDVLNHVSEWTFVQTYLNNETNPIEAFYTFPTPAGASVYDFTATIGDRLIKTVLKEKEKAKEEYNKAISDGHGAFYMERVSGDVFSVSLGNVQPQSEVVITIKYVVELKTEIDCSRLRLSIPLTIMPRYTPYNNKSLFEAKLQGKLVNPTKVDNRPYSMSIRGSLNMPDGIVSVDSKTHKMKMTNMKDVSMNFEINNLENLNEDIVVTIERNQPKSSSMTQKASDLQLTNELYRYSTMVNIVPSFKDVPDIDPAEVHYTILLDKSGSMSGSDIENCKQGAKIFLLSLPVGSSFDVYQFDDRFEKFKPTGNIDPKFEAISWVDKIKSGGGTELRLALEDVYKSIRLTGKRGVIIVLSDGGISDTQDVLKLVKRNKETSVFTIGIGQSVSHDLIQGMADMGNGRAEFVNSGTDQIKEKIHAQLKRAQTSLRKGWSGNDIKIDTEGPYRLVPETIPTLYENDLNTFYIFSQNPLKSVQYTQTLKDYTLNTNIPFTVVENSGYPLHRMAGIRLIELLANNPSGSQVEHLKQDPYKSTITELSLNLGILSNYTSFVGVEYREEKDKTTQQSVLREVPLQVAKKYVGVAGPCGPCGPSGSWGYCGMPAMAAACCAAPRSLGINTIGTSHKNASYDLRSVPSGMSRDGGLRFGRMEEKPESEDMGFDLFGGGSTYDSDDGNEICCVDCDEDSDLGGGMFGGDDGFEVDKHSKTSTSTVPKYNIVATIDKLPQYVRIGDLLTGAVPGSLPQSDKLKANDYIHITGEGSAVNGVYKVWNVGSATESWVLEKVH